MKTLIFCVFSIWALFNTPLLAQVEQVVPPPPMPPAAVTLSADSNHIYETFEVHQMPSFPGGEMAMYQYIGDQLNYPRTALENGISGIVIISFIIDKDGAITEPTIRKDIGGGCGGEALRMVKAMPRWSPAMINGQLVKVRYMLPVRFKLEGKAKKHKHK